MSSRKTVGTRGRDPRIAYFNALADRWDTTVQDPQMMVRQVMDHADQLQLKSGQDLLEVGCGTGQLTGWLVDQVAPGKVVAIDFAEAMLGQARRKNIPADFRCLDICRETLGDTRFDVILCFHSFPHFRDPFAALLTMVHSLQSNGRILIMHLAGRAKINELHHGIGGAVGSDFIPSDKSWLQLLSAVGLKIQSSVDRDDLFFLEAVADRK